MSTHKTCFHGERRKIFLWLLSLSRTMESVISPRITEADDIFKYKFLFIIIFTENKS